MKYLLDTDHLSILQRKTGPEYIRLSTWMAQFTALDFACCVVSLHEQLLGAHAFLNKANNSFGLIRGYELLERLPRDYLAFALLPFDVGSAAIYDQLLGQNLRVGTMDLRLASIALTHDLTVLTRNLRDFVRVPASASKIERCRLCDFCAGCAIVCNCCADRLPPHPFGMARRVYASAEVTSNSRLTPHLTPIPDPLVLRMSLISVQMPLTPPASEG